MWVEKTVAIITRSRPGRDGIFLTNGVLFLLIPVLMSGINILFIVNPPGSYDQNH